MSPRDVGDLLPDRMNRIYDTLVDPDQVRRSKRFENAKRFSKWYTDLKEDKYVVVVVVSDADESGRHWIITAYLTTKLVEGVTEWKRN
jgi:L-amino acid N-acyltransferase YncA